MAIATSARRVGRRTRTILRAVRRALKVRDDGCRFPGCTQRRFVDGHHIVHWSAGGPTSLDNLALLCRFHDRLVHEGGFDIRRNIDGRLEFQTPAGVLIPASPEPSRPGEDLASRHRHLGLHIGPDTGKCLWGGESMDLGLAIDALLCLEERDDWD